VRARIARRVPSASSSRARVATPRRARRVAPPPFATG